ncbi:universal stress protein [Halorarius halobius]|uniref:universal stress protein n=1 Tax=Halorarius halobius TaxID=2962671 RepID=UPI0020CECC49|nr:universal stress protein [Halorarius halobius]
MYNDVLVPTDGSDAADAAVDHAIDHALRYDATLHVVHVVDEESVPPTPDAGRVLGALEQQGRDAIERVARRAGDAGVDTVESAVVSGPPHEAILEYVDEKGVDLVVMGTHGRRGLDRYLLGSVTERVVRLADVPVLAVHPADTAQ